MPNLIPRKAPDVGPAGPDVVPGVGMEQLHVDARFDREKGEHRIVVGLCSPTSVLVKVEAERCEDPAVCVCRVTMGKKTDGRTTTVLGESEIALTVRRALRYKHVVVTDGQDILTVADVDS